MQVAKSISAYAPTTNHIKRLFEEKIDMQPDNTRSPHRERDQAPRSTAPGSMPSPPACLPRPSHVTVSRNGASYVGKIGKQNSPTRKTPGPVHQVPKELPRNLQG